MSSRWPQYIAGAGEQFVGFGNAAENEVITKNEATMSRENTKVAKYRDRVSTCHFLD